MDSQSITILRIIEGLWESYEWVPLKEISSRLAPKVNLNKKLDALRKMKLVTSRLAFNEPSIKITEHGLDTLAVWDFSKHGVLDNIGHKIGEGKEAVVVLGLKDGKKIAVKFHRYYSAEFRKIKDSLAYSAVKWWKKKTRRLVGPIDIARAKAQVEYHALNKLKGKLAVPTPLGINRHAIAMKFIGDELPAPLLSKTRKESWMLDEVLDNYEMALKEGIVHGDLSPYNVMMWDKPYLIDWPQAIPTDFENAKQLIERDKKRIKEAFSKLS